MADVVSLEERKRRNRERANKWYADNHKVETTGGFRSTCQICGEEFFAPRKNVRVCGEGGCDKELKRRRLQPFTIRHFERWASNIILDTEKPWRLEEFHRLFLEDLFAGKQECWLLIAEGNTKTTFLAGIGLYHCQHRRGGRVPVAASSRDQAFEMYLQAQGMVERSSMLQPLFTCHEGLRQIKCESMAARLQVYAADDRTGDGVIFTLALLDELHRHRDMRLYRTWAGKLEKRGGQIAAISTAGEPGSEFELTRDTIRQTAEMRETRPGYIRAESEAVVLHEYAVPEKGDVEDMELVKLANPFSGVTLASLKRKRNKPTMTLEHWRRFSCNLATRGGSAAITEKEWFSQATEEEIPEGVPIWAGLDVAWKWDTTAVVPLWIRDEEFRLLGSATILEPPRDGNSLNPDLVEEALLSLHERNPLHTLVMDTTKAEQLATWAETELGCEVVDRGQSNAFQAVDYEKWTEALRNGWLWHRGDPGLSKHVLNAVARLLPGGKVRFDRPKAARATSDAVQQRRVIDALTAASMAHTVAAEEFKRGQEGWGGAVYG